MTRQRARFSAVLLLRSLAVGVGTGPAFLDRATVSASGRGRLLDALPHDLADLQMLCSDLGLQKACNALPTVRAPSSSKGYSMLGDVKADVESGRGRRAGLPGGSSSEAAYAGENPNGANFRTRSALSTGEQCLPPGKLIFQHVMKTGGLSLERFFSCSCLERPSDACSVYIKNNKWEIIEPLHSDCPPSICSTHLPATETAEACGADFADAPRFTTVREPVSRVWSFYNFLRRWYIPYNRYTLKEILQNYSHADLNEGLPETEQCFHCHQQLSNAMTAHHYAGIDAARDILRSMRVIIDLERLSDFPEIADNYALFPEHLSLSGSTACAVQHIRPTEYDLGTHPDPETAELIAEHNEEDLMLYKFVSNLPQYES